MRTIAAGHLSALRGERPDLVVLFEMATGIASPATWRWTPRSEPIAWNGNTYEARASEVADEIRSDGHAEAARLTLHVANADGYVGTLIAANADLLRKRTTLRIVEHSRLTASPVESVAFRFYVDGWTFTQGLWTVDLAPLSGLLRQPFPRNAITKAEYPGVPRDLSGL